MNAPGRFVSWWRLLMMIAAVTLLSVGGYFLSLPYHHYRGLVLGVACIFCVVSAWKPPRVRRKEP